MKSAIDDVVYLQY